MYVLGIDIGTTTICVSAVDAETGIGKKAITVNSESFIETDKAYEKIQSVEIIEGKVFDLLAQVRAEAADVCAIGVTGQMHGIVYTDENGVACSSLATWQDGRAAEKAEDGKTYCEKIKELTGYSVAPGYGLATHYYNLQNGLVPAKARSFCTIHDYIAMRLCGRKTPLMHSSDAASFGLFDIKNARFDTAACEKLGFDISMLPEVTADTASAGSFEGIPVSVAIGDNQASFIGSVDDSENTILVNIGTGSQISVKGAPETAFPSGEVRPLTGDDYILVGSALCGGRVYACLEKFFRETFRLQGGGDESAYRFMDDIAESFYPLDNELIIDTAFSGKRSAPDVRGSIQNICTDNLTPAHLVCGVLKGSVRELYDMYLEVADTLSTKPTKLVGSGNGLRKSLVWRKMCEEMFGLSMSVPAHKEEAAYGAAVFALAACGVCESIKEAQKIIRYIGE